MDLPQQNTPQVIFAKLITKEVISAITESYPKLSQEQLDDIFTQLVRRYVKSDRFNSDYNVFTNDLKTMLLGKLR